MDRSYAKRPDRSQQGSAPMQSMDEVLNVTSLSTFAQAVCFRFQHEIKVLPKEHIKGGPRVILLARLANLQARLKALGHVLNDDEARSLRIALDMLEHLCKWPVPFYISCTASCSTFSPRWYPSLCIMLLGGEWVREPLKLFFNGTKLDARMHFWARLLSSLTAADCRDAGSVLKGPDLPELREWRVTCEACLDKESFISGLNDSLVKLCHCTCKPACKFMVASIRLVCYDDISQLDDNNVSKFNLLIQDLHDSRNSQISCYWRNIQISVCATTTTTTTTRATLKEMLKFKKLTKSVHVSKENEPDGHCGSVIEDLELPGDLRACQIVKKARKPELQVQLTYSNGKLRLEREILPSRHFLTNIPSTSLADLLHCTRLTDRGKAVLSYSLVESVWQYYDYSWAQWNNETVRFVSERTEDNDDSEVVFVNQPFLRVILEQPATKSSWNQRPTNHHYPSILALGITLLEIQFNQRFESFKTSDEYDENSSIDQQHLKALDILNDKTLWPPDYAWRVIIDIIETCLDDKKAQKLLKNDERKVRQRIYEYIVAPLRVFMLKAWEPTSIEPVTLWKTTRLEEVVAQGIKGPSHRKEKEKDPIKSLGPADEWLRNLGDLTGMLSNRPTRDEKHCPQIKIAILDTGIAKEYYDAFEDYVAEYKDFISGKDAFQQDGSGHGTKIIELLLRLNDNVKVFIGRVFERDEAGDETERVMAEAIMHAKLKWKVDIICIPSGFRSDLSNTPFRDQLYKAVTFTPEDPKTLIFAAASNRGFSSEITYPGCLSKYSKLICLFAAAGDGDPQTLRLNPAAVPKTYNFSLLGEGIKISPKDRPCRGTSYSTAIAAAIAASIMDFANHSDTRGKIRDVRYLREVEGMTSVFASMTAVLKDGYHILEPWKLMKHYENKSLTILELRQEICRNISRALCERNSRSYLF